jgi:hypothetical protein
MRVKINTRMSPRTRSAMKVTTLRFGADLWRVLETEAARAGVSTSQYIREAALARAAAAAAARGHGPYELLAGALREVTHDEPDPHRRANVDRTLAALARLTAAENLSDAEALQGQTKQTIRRAEKSLARSDSLIGNQPPPDTQRAR